MRELSKKISSMSASLTLALTAKASELRESGINVISFGAGEPDFNTPKNIRDAAIKAMDEGRSKYTQTSGISELKKLICKKFKDDNNLEYQENNIMVSTGAKQCLTNIFMTLLNPGDEVIVPSPYWVSYPELIKLADGKAVFAETSKLNAFKLTAEDIRGYYTENTKAIIINSPNNPTGSIYTKSELLEIAQVCKECDIFIISDEIYEKLNYTTDIKHVSIASLNEDSFKRTIVINGFSKAYAMTGWRVGYVGASSDIIKVMTTIQSHTTSNTNTIAQYACVEALDGNQESVNEMIKVFAKRRDLMVKLLSEIEAIECIEPKGAFYCFIDIKKCFNNEIKNSLDFASKLLKDENVVVIPGDAFGNSEFIRLSYATSEENIVKGLERIKNFVNNIL